LLQPLLTGPALNNGCLSAAGRLLFFVFAADDGHFTLFVSTSDIAPSFIV
jgi:hypothetical protein